MQEQFTNAVRHLNAGRLEEALAIVEALAQSHREVPQVQHLLGVIHYELGDAERGEAALKRAAAMAPDDPEIPYNHASALLRAGDHERALTMFDRCLAKQPGHAAAWNNRGTALQSMDRAEEAADSYRQALAQDPGHAGAMFNLADLAMGRGAEAEAETWLSRCLAARPDHAAAWTLQAALRREQGRLGDALQAGRRAVEFAPDSFDAHHELGRVQMRIADYQSATVSFKRCMQLREPDADLFNDLANARLSTGDAEGAESALREALELTPDHREAFVNLVSLLEMGNRLDEAAEWLARAPFRDLRLDLVRAEQLRREGSIESAIDLLEGAGDQADEPAGDETAERMRWFALGRLRDRAGRETEAWDAFVRGNQLALAAWDREDHPPDRTPETIRRMHQALEAMSSWADVEGPTAEESPIFLFGFQRTGTTLVDVALGAHEAVHVMEELPIVNLVARRISEQHGEYPEALPNLTAAELAGLRDFYFEQAARLGGFDGSTTPRLLDKGPLHTLHLPLIRLLFPNAPLILAVRHPCDVCLSCFMQDFTMTSFMTNYASIEGVVGIYEQVMSLWLRFQEVVRPEVFELRYEELVDDTEAVLRGLLDHLGLEWQDACLDHRAAARDRGLINTPSYNQVTEPIYRRARYRWRRYAPLLGDAIDPLRPWSRRFGYDWLDETFDPD